MQARSLISNISTISSNFLHSIQNVAVGRQVIRLILNRKLTIFLSAVLIPLFVKVVFDRFWLLFLPTLKRLFRFLNFLCRNRLVNADLYCWIRIFVVSCGPVAKICLPFFSVQKGLIQRYSFLLVLAYLKNAFGFYMNYPLFGLTFVFFMILAVCYLLP